MKFKKVPNVFMFSKYVREDGKYTITAEDRKNKRGTYATVFVVEDVSGNEIDILPRLKEAKEKYAGKQKTEKGDQNNGKQNNQNAGQLH